MKKYEFIKFARTVNKGLQSIFPKYGIKIRDNSELEVFNTETDGWEINLRYVSKIGAYVEIWYDRWLAYDDRKLWYGFLSRKKEHILNLSKEHSKIIGKPIILTEADIDVDSPLHRLHLKQFEKVNFDLPTLEFYNQKRYFFYGIYEYNPIDINNPSEQVARIVSFYDAVLEFSGKKLIDSDAGDYFAYENRKRVANHIQRERNPGLVLHRKQLDNFQCFVCGFDFSTYYGKLGKNFAEAHHIIPLSSSNRRRITKIDDLITVCSNCHRILHRMEGEKNDITKLKRLVKKMKSKI
jgi:hypothetical protein